MPRRRKLVFSLKCKVVDIAEEIMCENHKDRLIPYVFEKITTNYYNKNGKLCNYDRTACVDKKDVLPELASQLQSLSQKYLLHRYFVKNLSFIGKGILKPANIILYQLTTIQSTTLVWACCKE